MKNSTLITLAVLLLGSSIAKAQDLLDQLYFEEKSKTVATEATFKMLRIGLAHSVETRKKGVLELSSYTRYWNIPRENGVATENKNFAADRMSARFGFDYALSDNFSTGLGWSNQGVWDGYFKLRILRQKTGAKKTPFSVTGVAIGSYRAENIKNVVVSGGNSIYNPGVELGSFNKQGDFSERTTFTGQLLIARKLNRNLSFQISPSVIVRGSNQFADDPSTQLSIGFGGRYKVGKHVSIATEYFYTPESFALESVETFGPYTLGVNWEVSKVQIQMFLTHTGHFAEDIVFTETQRNFNTKDGNLFFGWNFSYVFHLKKKK